METRGRTKDLATTDFRLWNRSYHTNEQIFLLSSVFTSNGELLSGDDCNDVDGDHHDGSLVQLLLAHSFVPYQPTTLFRGSETGSEKYVRELVSSSYLSFIRDRWTLSSILPFVVIIS